MATPLAAQAPATQNTATTSVPGIPNQPDLVTMVPFYWKPNETASEKTKVVISADVDGRHGIFILDLGSPMLMLNRTFLQPSHTGGADTVTDTNRIPDHSRENDVPSFDKVRVTMRIGTLRIKFDDTTMKGPYNAYLGHAWGNFGWNFAPRLGNIGPTVLEPFETIIDYTHRRLILIRLDSAGHRRAKVPAYTPKWSAPLMDVSPWHNAWQAWGIAVRPDNTLDTLNTANNTKTIMMDTGAPDSTEMGGYTLLGYSFLNSFGVVGFNHRTHQFILYR